MIRLIRALPMSIMETKRLYLAKQIMNIFNLNHSFESLVWTCLVNVSPDNCRCTKLLKYLFSFIGVKKHCIIGSIISHIDIRYILWLRILRICVFWVNCKRTVAVPVEWKKLSQLNNIYSDECISDSVISKGRQEDHNMYLQWIIE